MGERAEGHRRSPGTTCRLYRAGAGVIPSGTMTSKPRAEPGCHAKRHHAINPPLKAMASARPMVTGFCGMRKLQTVIHDKSGVAVAKSRNSNVSDHRTDRHNTAGRTMAGDR